MDFFTFSLAVLLLELTPGPNMTYLAALALSRGRAAGLIATAGVTFGLAVHAVVAGLGAGVLIQQYPLLYDMLRWIGVGYLLYLAWEGFRTEKETSPERADLTIVAGPLFLRGFLSNVFNPKSILFFVSVLPTFVATGSSAPSLTIQMAAFGILYVGIATVVHGAIVILAAQLRPWLVEGPSHGLCAAYCPWCLPLSRFGWLGRRGADKVAIRIFMVTCRSNLSTANPAHFPAWASLSAPEFQC